jgi:hypothetical protein
VTDRCETNGRREKSRPAAVRSEFLATFRHRPDQASNGVIELPSGRRERPRIGPKVTEARSIGRQRCRNRTCTPRRPRHRQRIHEFSQQYGQLDLLSFHKVSFHKMAATTIPHLPNGRHEGAASTAGGEAARDSVGLDARNGATHSNTLR